MGKETLQLDFHIRKMTYKDLPSVARVHKKSWREDHFSSRLSLPLLEIYYEYILKYNSYCFVAERNSKVIGFGVGGSNTRTAIKEFLDDNFLSMVVTVIKNPSFIFSRIKNYITIMTSSSKVNSFAKVRFLALAVDPDIEGKGIGAALMKHLEDAVRKDGHEYLGLSVHKDNKRAIELYHRLGWKAEKKEGSALYYIMKLN